MKVIIPLAGFGTRLRPHTYTKPKPLINVAGKAVLGHILDEFAGLEVEEFIIVHGYLGEQIKTYMAEKYPHYRARYVEQKELLGQAHAIWLCRDYVDGPVLIVFVDTIFKTDLRVLEQETADGVAYVKEVEDPRRFGVAIVGPEGFVTRFIEKPTSIEHNLAVIGLYYIKDSRLLMQSCEELMRHNIQTKGEYYLADALNLMIAAGQKFRVRMVEVWEDCGKPETVLHTNRYLLMNGHDNSAEMRSDRFIIVPPVHIDPSATIIDSVIGPYVTIAENCRIERSIIRDSIIDAGAVILDTTLDQSLIGKEAYVAGRYRRLNVGDSASVDFS